MKRVAKVSLLILTLVCLFTLAACGKVASTVNPPAGKDPIVDPVPDPPDDGEDFVPTGNVNPLTGLCDGISDEALTRKPVAIMVSNSYDSLPQWGVTQPDIIYEMLAEGRISRLLAIFQDPSKIEKLASVRSARPYFIDIAQSYGAVYMHFGGSVPAYDAIAKRTDLIDIDGIKGSWEGTLFFRDPTRRKQIGLEHSVYTEGGLIEAALKKLNKDLTQEEHPSAFTFATHHSAENGTEMTKVTVTYSAKNMPWFEYNADSGTYLRYQYGDPHIDAWLKKQIEIKNVFVLRMKTVDVAGSELKLVEVTTSGSGSGYYFCDGRYVEIKWTKEGYNKPISFFDTEGNPLKVARGQTFISVVTETASIDIE